MENKINVAELLKDCPSGMELDCTMWDNVVLDHIDMTRDCPIYIRIKGDGYEQLTKYGQWNHSDNAKCVIFPKGKTTWEGFQRPFKDGDIVFYDHTIAIFKEWDDETLFTTYVTKYLCCDSLIDTNISLFGKSIRKEIRFATEEEKEKLFQAIKDNGYNWNAETRTLEKMIKPKFKVGDRIRRKNDKTTINTIVYSYYDSYGLCDNHLLPFKEQDQYELVSDKFDINTLIPFESKVLARDHKTEVWKLAYWGFYDETSSMNYPYETVGGNGFGMCIPYEGNEHLFKTNNDCDDYYKTWK